MKSTHVRIIYVFVYVIYAYIYRGGNARLNLFGLTTLVSLRRVLVCAEHCDDHRRVSHAILNILGMDRIPIIARATLTCDKGFRVQVIGFRVWGLGFRVKGLGFRV